MPLFQLANILFARELGKKLSGSGITSYSLHPGVVATEIDRHAYSNESLKIRSAIHQLLNIILKLRILV
jgi:NAD(P)-dependent dehydrogenase (short-subunit alcohol dehydrogenase family)